MRAIGKGACALALAALAAGAALAAKPSPSAWDAQRRLDRGVNIIGYDPLWQDFRKGRFKTYHFFKIRQAGFSTVRIVLQSFDHMDKRNRLSQKWLDTLDWALNGATHAGLNAIVDEHDFEKCGDDAAGCEAKLIAFWQQVGHHLRKRGDNVLFELLNEPHGQLDAARWNALLAKLLPVVRRENPTRNLIIGPTQWNNFRQLDMLQLPEKDRHIIVTFHYYDPMHFTHQGANWVEGMANVSGVPWGSPEERAKIDSDFDQVAAWSKEHDRPIFLGEFGALERGEMKYRTAWTSAVARSAERHGFAWAYWQFDSNFIAYDMKKEDWVHPILKALIPNRD
jgi:endoglucanase